MKAISLRRLWAWAVSGVRLRDKKRSAERSPGKLYENREWFRAPGLVAQARAQVGKQILIHASLTCTRVEYDYAMRAIRGAGLIQPHEQPAREDLPGGVLVARARLVEVVRTLPDGCRVPHPGSPLHPCLLCGQVRLRDLNIPCPKADLWAIPDQVGLVLADMEPLPALVPAKGALGLWQVDDDALADAVRIAAKMNDPLGQRPMFETLLGR